MLTIEILRAIIVGVGWAVLVGGTIHLWIKGDVILKSVEGSILGRLAKVVIFTMTIGTYCLGIVSTAFLYTDLPMALYLVAPVFIVWLVLIFWAMRVVAKTAEEVRRS